MRAYKTELNPNNKQRTYFRKCAGVARFVYNWALADRIEKYKQGNSTNMYEQKRRFNALKGEEFPWIYEVPYTLQEQAFQDLDNAYKHFFRRLNKGDEKKGFPKFKSRSRGIGSFTLRGCIYIEDKKIKLPRIGWARLKERGYIPSDKIVKLNSVTISEKAGRWYVSAQVEKESEILDNTNGVLGIDVGINHLAVCSDGTIFDNPKAFEKYYRKLRRLSKELSRRKRGSSNYKKTKKKLARCHQKIHNLRIFALHQVSSYAVYDSGCDTIVLEDLNVKGMTKNRHLSRAVSDASMSELIRQIEYKAEWKGTQVIKADRFYPSSKLCSNCQHKKEDLKLSQRVYKCEKCGLEIDRDLNAAKNLAALTKAETQPDCLGS